MSFVSQWQQLDWDHLRLSVNGHSTGEVEQALASASRGQGLSVGEFEALISPAAAPYLEQMAQLSQRLTRQRFGNTMGLYLPLYLSNLCANDCDYCGFSMSNRIKRHTLSPDELERELTAIKNMGFDAILLVTGEHQSKVGMDYFREVLPQIKRHFSYLMMEVQPLKATEYAELRALGLDAVMVYQESYHKPTYLKHHLRGSKTNFEYRLDTPDRLGQAGVDKIGLGALFGLADWRSEAAMVVRHHRYLQKRYWRSRYSISFPRLRPCTGGVEPVSPMGERELLQLMCAFRLYCPELELSLSTRESAHFRDNVMTLAPTTMSAGSSTRPGGYAEPSDDLAQFSIDDLRSPAQVASAISNSGLTPVWKDWDRAFG